MKQAEAKIIVNSSFSQSGKLLEEGEQRDQIEITLFPDGAPVVSISVDKSLTKNLGNYSSAKVSAFCSVPCYLNEEEMGRAAKFANAWCDKLMESTLTEFTDFLTKKYPALMKEVK